MKVDWTGYWAGALALVAVATGAQAAVNISTQATQNMSCSAGVCMATAQKAVLNVNDLTAMLAAGDATVKSGSIAQDIDINAAISWASASRLTIDSYHSINFEKPLTITGSSGALTITTNDGGYGGDFSFAGKGHVEYWDVAGLRRLVINGYQYQLAESSRGISRGFRHGGYDRYVALARSYDAGKGVHSSPIIGGLQGTFEGLGNTISNLRISDTVHTAVGFVGGTSEYSAMIRDLNLVNASVSVGVTTGASPPPQSPAYAYVGLLVGHMAASFGPHNVFRCSATGHVSVGANISVGGLVGRLDGRMSQSHADVTIVAGDGTWAGGLIGYNELGYVDQSYATGSVTGGNNAFVGGLVGYQFGNPITNSYASGAATGGKDSSVGGLVGSIDQNGLSTSYSTGPVTGGRGAAVGGLIGRDTGQSGDLSSDYWDLDTSGISKPSKGAGNVPNDAGITGLTDAQLKSALPDGFDPQAWGQNPNINNGYPYLLANPPPH